METVTISRTTARRFVLGRQGLWPGRRWAGCEGTAEALRAVEAVQMDPLNVVARSHDIAMWGRVADYRPEYLDRAMYTDREFFDYGGTLKIYPMSELPFWRVHMRRREQEPRWTAFVAEHQSLINEVRDELCARGPLGNRDFTGYKRVNSYRGSKDTSVVLFYLWLTGELMIHHREGFHRVYYFRDRVAPPELNYSASDEEAEEFFARKKIAFLGLISGRRLQSSLAVDFQHSVSRAEARQRLDDFLNQEIIAPVSIEGSKDSFYALRDDLPLLNTLEMGEVPVAWRPLTTTTREEAVFLAPLDIVSERRRAAKLFDFEYIWEVYKPVAARRWGYYTLPILYDDRLVARLDPRLDRANATLEIKGFWLEDHAPLDDPAFAAALARGLVRFATFLNAQRLDIAPIKPRTLRADVRDIIGTSLDVQVEAKAL